MPAARHPRGAGGSARRPLIEPQVQRDVISFAYIERMREHGPAFASLYGHPSGIDLLPKPTGPRLPLLITGSSRHSLAVSAPIPSVAPVMRMVFLVMMFVRGK